MKRRAVESDVAEVTCVRTGMVGGRVCRVEVVWCVAVLLCC